MTTLAEAVGRHVRAGDMLYLGAAHGRANPLIREVVRQWWGRRPDWTLATVGLGSPWTALVHGGLVRRVITTFMGEGYPFPTPQPLISRAVLEGRLDVSNWSMLTFPLRLLAGAMGLPFLPTRSLLGSSMEEDNARAGDLIVADDPFGAEGRVAMVRALVPDVALIHAWAADRSGNLIAAPPLNENLYGAMAARRGAIVTVEKIVSTDVIRRHANLVRLPAQYVQAVVETPHGNHPGGMWGITSPSSRATRRTSTGSWNAARPSGSPRPRTPGSGSGSLMSRITPPIWPRWATPRSWRPRAAPTPTPGSRSWSRSRAGCRRRARAGARRPPAPSWPSPRPRACSRRRSAPMATGPFSPGWATRTSPPGWGYELKRAGVDIEIMAETGMVGYLPRPAEPFVFSFRNFPSCKMLTEILHVMGIFMGGRHNQCLGSLAAGQIDKHGNINSTIIPGVTYVTGSGGANDITSSAREVVVCLEQSTRRFVDKVPYITAPGRTVRTVVSQLGVYEKDTEHGELRLTGILGTAPEAEAAQAARAACGWDLQVAPRLRRFEAPTDEELGLIRLFDPRRYFLG